MSRRKRAQHEEPEPAQPQPPTVDREAWHTPEFRRRALIDLAFVALPAVVMAALGAYGIAAAWFGVGVLVLIWQFWRQIRDFWRSLRSRPPADQNEGDEQG